MSGSDLNFPAGSGVDYVRNFSVKLGHTFHRIEPESINVNIFFFENRKFIRIHNHLLQELRFLLSYFVLVSKSFQITKPQGNAGYSKDIL